MASKRSERQKPAPAKKVTRSKERTVEIYGLFDPSGGLRYIGKAIDSPKRFAGHLREKRRRTPLYDWIEGLRKKGQKPSMSVLEIVNHDQWEDAERQHIASARAMGCRLLNLAPGGNQPFATPESRSRSAKGLNAAIASNPRRAMIRSVKQRLARGLRGGFVSQELRERIKLAADQNPQFLGYAASIIRSQETQ